MPKRNQSAVDTKSFPSVTEFHIGLNVNFAAAPLSRLAQRLKSAMPGLELIIRNTNIAQTAELLTTGEICVGVGHALQYAADLETTWLGKTALCLIWRRADELDQTQAWLRSELLKSFNVVTSSP